MNGDRFIPVAAPVLRGNEEAYVLDCLRSTWISSNGKYIDLFEQAFADFCGTRHAVACTNGTVALHLALLAHEVGPGDEVVMPTLTYVATANAVQYCGARPKFVDVDPDTWTLDVSRLEQSITAQTKGIIAVHLFGQPAEMDAIREIARRRSLFVIEDAAEAHGALYSGRPAGSLGDAATFSFYGNKIITTGEGGMVTTNDDRLADQMRLLKGQGMDPHRRYWFPVVGYNYRMTNIAAAIGLAQLENIEWHLERRLEVASWYRDALRDVAGLTWQIEPHATKHSYWMFSVVLDESLPCSRDGVMDLLLSRGIETRPVFYPMHALPPYQADCDEESFPVADRLSSRGFSLPTWAGVSRDDVEYVGSMLVESLNSAQRTFSAIDFSEEFPLGIQ